jgi:predicted kinase
MLSFKLWLAEVDGGKILIIMRGFPGSGKSTLAQQLGKGGVVFSTDDYFMSPEGKYEFDPARLGQYHQANLERTREAMQQGISPVVVDNTNVNARAIRPYALLAQEFGYEMEFREPETPWKHDAEELARRNSHGVPKHSIEKMLRQWTPDLTPDYFKASSSTSDTGK